MAVSINKRFSRAEEPDIVGGGGRLTASAGAVATAVACVLLACATHGAEVPRSATAAVLQLDIPSQPIGDALSRLAEVAGVQIVFYSDVTSGVRAQRLTGQYTLRAALDLMLAGSALEYEFLSEHTVAVRVRGERASSPPQPPATVSTDPDERASSPAVAVPVARERDHVSNRRDRLELEEVTVTARRRSESLQDTPVAVTAFNAEALELRGVRTADALAQFVPNLQFDGSAPLSGAAYNATIFIRGVGQNDFAIFSDPGVAMYLDGVYLGRSIGGVMDLLDLAQVEVLRGPQGTLFGRNTIGGAIILHSRQPDTATGGEVAVTVGNLDRREVRAVLNLPITDTVLTRFTAATLHRDGYGQRLTDGTQLGDRDAAIGRAQIAWHPSDRFSAAMTLDATRVRQNSAPLTLIDVAASGVPYLNLYNALVAPSQGIVAPDGSTGIDRSWVTGDHDTTFAAGRSVNDLDSVGAALTLEWQMGATDFKSITAWRSLEAVFARDGDNTPFTFRETFNSDTQRQLSQDLQWSGSSAGRRLEWVSGLYLFSEDATENGRAILAPGLYEALESLDLEPGYAWCGLSGANPRPAQDCPASLRFGAPDYHDNDVLADLDVDLHTRVANRSAALFGQGTYRVAKRWSVTAGLRWTFDEKELELVHRRRASGAYVVGAPGTQRIFTTSWSELTPKLGLEWQISDDAMTYLSYARGYKSGGFNGRPLAGIEEVRTPYDPEVVDSYEFGAKTRWFDGRMTANAALFYNEYRDMQLSINATPQNFVRNAGAARIRGGELEVAARLAPGLDLNLALGLLDTRYTRLDPQLATLRPPLTTDKQLIKAPATTLSSGLQYRWSLAAGTITLRGDYMYRSRVHQDVFNDPRLVQPAFDVVNAYAAFTTSNRRWELALSGTNLTDERYRLSGNSSVGFGLAETTFSAPREFSATLRLRF
jgi:iron complex outermembrane receptor protein